MCFLFLSKASSPCYAVSLSGPNHRQDRTTHCTSASWSLPAAKLPLRQRCIGEHRPRAGRCCRRCPAKPCCSGKAVMHKRNAFLGSPQHRRLPRQVEPPGRLSRQHPISSSADPPLLGSSPWPAALRVAVNGAALAKDKSLLQGVTQHNFSRAARGVFCRQQSMVQPVTTSAVERGPPVCPVLTAASTACLEAALAGGLSLPALSCLGASPGSKPSPCLPFLPAESERTICYPLVAHLPFN